MCVFLQRDIACQLQCTASVSLSRCLFTSVKFNSQQFSLFFLFFSLFLDRTGDGFGLSIRVFYQLWFTVKARDSHFLGFGSSGSYCET